MGSSSIVKDAKQNSNKINIKILPLAQLLKQEKIHKLDVLKIDIEGFEDKALFSYFRALDKKLYPRLIIIEDSRQADWDENILEWLIAKGYSILTRTRSNVLISLKKVMTL